MTLHDALCIRPGVTAVIGGGGKTTLLRTLGEELAGAGHTVVLCTTTKIYPFPGLLNLAAAGEGEVSAALAAHPLLCMGTPLPDTGKLTAPGLPMAALMGLADCVLVEADGAAGRPMKAHAPHEPVIPAEANQVICVVGASGFGKPVSAAAHRPERYAALAGVFLETPITPEAAAAVLLAEGLHDRVYINQAETAQRLTAGKQLQTLLPCPTSVGVLKQEGGHVICW